MASALPQTVPINEIRRIQEKNNDLIETSRRRIGRLIHQMTEPGSEKATRYIESDIKKQQSEIRKATFRLKMWDRILFYVERYYHNGSLHTFFRTKLIEIAKAEALSESPDTIMWRSFALASRDIKKNCSAYERAIDCLQTSIINIQNQEKPTIAPNKLNLLQGKKEEKNTPNEKLTSLQTLQDIEFAIARLRLKKSASERTLPKKLE